ncbi:MAG TPA: sugar phosphate nucleotidyltransferase [Poseidonia sp.]|nr:sugar phosphate nucleotidyltransferase [Poseidonia sp.]
MQVVVLAGGVGSRLRPWTNSVPKPLLPMLDRTLLEHVVSSLPPNLVDEVVVAGGYKVDMIEAYFDEHEVPFDVRIVPEDKPLGTGGALGNCRDVVSGTFACFNGDIISSLDASSLLSLHKRNNSVGTLGLWEVEDPTRFGIVGLDDYNRITQFKEKPKPEEVFSNLINAGSYIFNDDIFDWMPKGKHSIEREVFPQLAKEGLLSGEAFEGYFIDAGTPSAWNQGVKACIEHQRFDSGEVVSTNWYQQGDDHSAAIVKDSMISKSCVLGNGQISQSSLLSDVHLGDYCHLDACLVGKGAQIGANCKLTGVVIDHGSIIPEGTVQNGGQWPDSDAQ